VPVAGEPVADLELAHRQPERVGPVGAAARAGHPLARDGREHVRAALDRRALHVVGDAADAAELLAAAGATRSAVDQVRQRAAVAGRLGRVVPVEHEDAAVEGGRPQHDGAHEGGVVADHAGDQGTPAQREQVDDLLGAVVGHEGGDGAERLDLVDRPEPGVVDREQHRGHERPALVALDDRVAGPGDRPAPGRDRPDGVPHGVALLDVDQRTHPGGGVSGSPTVAVASRAASASVTSPSRADGTNARRTAVHF
jgi:hypothetical protein